MARSRGGKHWAVDQSLIIPLRRPALAAGGGCGARGWRRIPGRLVGMPLRYSWGAVRLPSGDPPNTNTSDPSLFVPVREPLFLILPFRDALLQSCIQASACSSYVAGTAREALPPSTQARSGAAWNVAQANDAEHPGPIDGPGYRSNSPFHTRLPRHAHGMHRIRRQLPPAGDGDVPVLEHFPRCQRPSAVDLPLQFLPPQLCGAGRAGRAGRWWPCTPPSPTRCSTLI